MILAYLGAVYYEKNSRRNTLSRIPEKSKRYRVKFKPMVKEILYYCSAFIELLFVLDFLWALMMVPKEQF